MNCSMCGKRLPEDDNSIDSVGSVHLENDRGEVILSLHAECIKTVQDGLSLCHTLVVN